MKPGTSSAISAASPVSLARDPSPCRSPTKKLPPSSAKNPKLPLPLPSRSAISSTSSTAYSAVTAESSNRSAKKPAKLPSLFPRSVVICPSPSIRNLSKRQRIKSPAPYRLRCGAAVKCVR